MENSENHHPEINENNNTTRTTTSPSLFIHQKLHEIYLTICTYITLFNFSRQSFLLLFGSTFCLVTSCFLLIDGFQCHCQGFSPVKGYRECRSCIETGGEPGLSFEAVTGEF